MKLAALIIFCTIFTVMVQGQDQAEIDSLRQEMIAASGTAKVDLRNQLAFALKEDAPRKALVEAELALLEAQRLNYTRGVAIAYGRHGVIYSVMNEFDSSLTYFIKALEQAEISGDQALIAQAVNDIAYIYKVQDNYDEAIAYYQKALAIRKQLPEKKNVIMALNSLGIALTEVRRFEEADSCFMQMIDLATKIGDKYWPPRAYNQLARNYYFMRNYLEAIKHFTKALELEIENGNRKRQAVALSNIAECHHYLKEYDNALINYEKSLSIREDINYLYGMVITYLQMAKTYYRMGDLDRSILHSEKSLDLARKLGIKRKIVDALEGLAMLHAKKNNYKKAYALALQVTAEKDSILNQQKTKQIAEMQAKFDSERKEQQIISQENEIALLEEKKAADRQLVVLLVLFALALMLLIGFIYSRYKIKKKAENILTRKNQQIATINEELERKALRAQMDPHFIFNSLNSIQHFITTNNKTLALTYLSKFSKLIRQILENSVNHQVLIVDEIRLLEYYIQLEALRFDEKFEHQISIDESLDIHNTEIPFLLIQPYVENAIIHGLNNKDEKGSLKVSLEDKEQHILCTVEDNGVGREKAAQLKKAKKHISRGMSVTKRRLELLNRDKKNKTLVDVVDIYDQYQCVAGTKVEIVIPMEIN